MGLEGAFLDLEGAFMDLEGALLHGVKFLCESSEKGELCWMKGSVSDVSILNLNS